MAPTTITTIVLIIVGLVALGWAGYGWFSDWQPVVRRYMTEEERLEAEIQAAVRQMRQAIKDYEQGDRHL
jgi:uncharacterized protein YgfB (UPF0149 family)